MKDMETKPLVHLEPIWYPDKKTILDSNIQQWCNELHLADYSELHRWSIEHRVDFWKAAIERLNIRFEHLGETSLANDADPAHAIWFPEAQMNIVASCFQGSDEQVAVVAQAPGGPLRTMTIGELRKLTNRVANSVRTAGFKTGDQLAVVLPMTQRSIPLYLGIITAGCSVVSIADSFAAPEIATRLRIAQAKGVFTYDAIRRGGKSLPLYERVCEATHLPTIVLDVSDEDSLCGIGQMDSTKRGKRLRDQDQWWNNFLGDDDQFSPVIRGANDCLNVLFSSGTTGEPKAIVWNHLTPLRCSIDGLVHQDLHPGDVAVWPTNLGWMMGPWLIFAALINRSTIGLYEDSPLGSGFGSFVEQAKVTMLGVVPTIVKSWRSSRAMEEFDWTSIRCFSSTGETSQPEDMIYLSELGGKKPIIEYCGGTEIGGGYVTSTMVQPNVPSAFTTPAIGLDFLLLNDQYEAADEGEVYLVPPSIGLSNCLLNRDHYETYYARLPQGPNGEILRRHGDYFRRVEGHYIAGGRTDDTMNLGGIKISSAELERVLNQIDGICETAAVAISERHGPDRLVVFAVLEKPLDPDALRSEMNQRLKRDLNPLFKVDQVQLVESLPRTASNKVMRRELRATLLQSPSSS